MKKLILCALAALSFTTVNAQSFKAFRNLGIGVEANLIGAGVQLSMPVVSDVVVLNLGYNFGLGIKANNVASIDKEKPNEGLEKLNNKISGDPGFKTFPYLTDDIDVSAKLKMGNNFKVMAEIYPSKKASFHFTVGALIGNGKIVNLTAESDKTTREIYDIAKFDQDLYNMNEHGVGYGDPNYEDFIFDNMRFNVDDKTYGLNGDDLTAKVTIKGNNVKPYFGIGWGRSIPRKRVGCQFEIGAWYHAKPKMSSPNEIQYDPYADGIDGVGDIMSKIQFFPQMTLRLTGRIL